MKNFILSSLLICGWSFILFGCTTEYIEPVSPDISVTERKCNMSRSLTKDEVQHLVGLFSEPMKALKLHDTRPIICSDTETRSTVVALDIEPITFEGDTLMWAANYPDNGGYMLLSADKTRFPVERYAETGNFNYDSLPAAEKKVFNQRLKEIRSQITFPRDSIPFFL